jgi:ABC-type uncharacterized transport system involved in gliding motility auxiliary subunit
MEDKRREQARTSPLPLFLAAAGILILLVGGLDASFRGERSVIASACFITGLSLTLVAAYLGRKELKQFVFHRASLYDVNNVLYVVTVSAILIILNLFAHRYSEHVSFLPKFDLTRNQFYTLSPQSVEILKGLKSDVRATVFFITPRGAGGAAAAIRKERAQLENLLKLYRGVSPHFSYRMVDPEKEPAIAEKYSFTLSGSVVLERDEKQIVVKRWAIFRPRDPIRNKKAAFTGEQALTNAFMRICDATMPMVYFIIGHRESNLNDSKPGGLSQLATRLKRDHYRLMQLNILKAKCIPSDAACIVIAGPTQDLSEPEEKIIKEYIQNGGNAIMLLDTGTPTSSYSRILEPYGVRLMKNFIVDPLNAYFNRPTWPIPDLNQHIITDDLIRYGRVPTFPNAMALEKFYENPKFIIRTIAQTSRQSWAETNFASRRPKFDKGQDLKGPLMAAFAVTSEMGDKGDSSHYRKEKEFRLVTIGDSDFITNRVIDMQANADFFLNCVAWVTGMADRITIRQKEVEGEKIPLSERKGEAIFYSCSLALPFTFLLTGCLVFWRRRNR